MKKQFQNEKIIKLIKIVPTSLHGLKNIEQKKRFKEI